MILYAIVVTLICLGLFFILIKKKNQINKIENQINKSKEELRREIFENEKSQRESQIN